MSNPSSSPESTRLEWLAIAAISAVGLCLRMWPFGRLGLTHFDEGIYAMSGTWVLEREGLAAIDPTLIPFAPPGYTILVGLMYGVLGRSDVSAIGVSQLAGAVAIPVVAWIARRTFGAGSGFAAATLVALSGPHIAFSRMALTDASFLLSWLIAMGTGMRFLDRPTAARGIAMGLAVGMAQGFKYNGWLSGALVLLAAGIGVATRPEERRLKVALRTFGWGILAVLIAGALMLPWYQFVEAHGGYSDLLRHQRSYLVGSGRWLHSFRTQADQAVALSGSQGQIIITWVVAALGGFGFRWLAAKRQSDPISPGVLDIAMPVTLGGIMVLIPNAAWWLGLAVVPGLVASRRPSTRLLGLWWLVLSILTPFYHPYARLWLPIHAVGWVVLGGWLGNGPSEVRAFLRHPRAGSTPGGPGRVRFGLAWAWFVAIGVLWSIELDRPGEPARILPGLFAPSDSLREAARQVVETAPKNQSALRLYGRPPLTFYLGGRLTTWPFPSPETIFLGNNVRQAVLFDRGMAGSTAWPPGIERWDYIAEIPTDLALPTLLDVNPAVATGRANIVSARSASLDLLRARPPKKDE